LVLIVGYTEMAYLFPDSHPSN